MHFERATHGFAVQVFWQLVELETTVQHGTADVAAFETSTTIGIRPVVRDRAFAVAGYLGRGGRTSTSDLLPARWAALTLSGPETLRIERATPANGAAVFGWFVVEL